MNGRPLTEQEAADRDARVLLAVTTMATPIMSEIAARCGLAPMSVYDSMRRLRTAGLVAWEPQQSGTIRATVEIVAASPW